MIHVFFASAESSGPRLWTDSSERGIKGIAVANISRTNGTTKILVVDGKQSRAIMLNSHGYDVESIGNIIEAYFFIQEQHPDLVLLELDRENASTFNFGSRSSFQTRSRASLF